MEIILSIILASAFGFIISTALSRNKLKEVEDKCRQVELENAAYSERMKLIDRYEMESKEKDYKIENQLQHISALKENEASLLSKISEREQTLQEKIQILEGAKHELSKQFAEISQNVLEKNNRLFLDLAQQSFEAQQKHTTQELQQKHELINQSVKGVHETLEKLGEHNHIIESKRVAAYSGLIEQVKSLIDSQTKLQRETGNLANALRAPSQRGRWGEMQLKRVVEMAGMLEYCDFQQQVSVTHEDGRLRPDMIVKLPNEKIVIVDSKVALDAYLDAISLEDENLCKTRLKDHARQVRRHVTQLSSKSYWNQFESTPEFVVMFLPGEPFFSTALEHDPQLIEFGSENRVLIATPVTLIALLRAVSYGWRQEKVAQSAQEISKMAHDLYSRFGVMADHFSKLGNNLDRSVKSYNEAVGSLERMVLPQVRKLREKGLTSQNEISTLEPIDKISREFQAPEFRGILESSLVE